MIIDLIIRNNVRLFPALQCVSPWLRPLLSPCPLQSLSLSLSELLLPKHLTELQSFDETMFTNLFETRGMKDELYPESLSSVPTSLDLSNILEWMCKEIDEPMMKTLDEKERTALG